MKRLCFAFAALLFTPRLLAGAFFYDNPLPSDSTGIVVTDLPNLEIVAEKESRTVTSATPVHVVDSEKIKATGITGISDALKRMPGVNVRDYGGAGGLKTVSVRGLGSKHTGVSYDGVALSDIRNGEIDLSAYSIENAASLSLTAGDNEDIFIPARNAASSASVEISSIKDPDPNDKTFKIDARLKTGAFGLWSPFIKTGLSNGKNLSLGATAEFTHAKNNYPFILKNGDLTTTEKRNNSRMNSLHTEINSAFIPTPGSSLTSKIYYYDNSRQLPGPVVYYVSESHEHLHERNFFAQTRYRNRLSSVFSLSGLAKFNWASSRYTDIAGSYPGGKLDQAYYQREVYASAAILCLPASSLALDYSADWFYNNLTSNLPSDTHPFRHSILQSLTARYRLPHVTITGRLLYSIYRDQSHIMEAGAETGVSDPILHQRLSPSFSVSVRPINNISLFFRASYKNIFRMPTFSELYFDNFGSVGLKPEKTDQWNTGITFATPAVGILTDLSITADGYINLVKDKIVAVPFNLFKWTMTNLGKVRIYGIDITLNAELSIRDRQSLLLAASYSYQRAQPRTSPDMLDWMKQVAYTPLNSGSASLSWLNPYVSPVVSLTATSSRYTTNANLPSTRISGYADFGLSAFHTFTFRSFSLDLRADILNILNKQYEIVARYPMPGRSWQASIRFLF